jgi:hypothetical protein
VYLGSKSSILDSISYLIQAAQNHDDLISSDSDLAAATAVTPDS